MSGLTAERLRSLLSYDPETGIFVWLKRADTDPRLAWWDTKYAGQRAGTLRPDGYFCLKVDRHLYQLHRLAWLHVRGEWPTGEIDHINGDRADNRLSNLREAAHHQNLCNRGPQRNNTSGFKGVHWVKDRSSWRSTIWVKGRQIVVGYFPTKELAAAAYERAASTHHGEFAKV